MGHDGNLTNYSQGYNKGASSSKPHAPWDGSTFAVEWENNKSEQQSEYNKTYYAKPVRNSVFGH